MYDALNKGFAADQRRDHGLAELRRHYTDWAFQVVGEIFATHPQVEWLTTPLPARLGCPRPGHASASGWTTPAGPLSSAARAWPRIRGSDHRWIQQESTFWRRSLWERAGGAGRHAAPGRRLRAVGPVLTSTPTCTASRRRWAGSASTGTQTHHWPGQLRCRVQSVLVPARRRTAPSGWPQFRASFGGWSAAGSASRRRPRGRSHKHPDRTRDTAGGVGSRHRMRCSHRHGVVRMMRSTQLPRITIVTPSFNQGRLPGADDPLRARPGLPEPRVHGRGRRQQRRERRRH